MPVFMPKAKQQGSALTPIMGAAKMVGGYFSGNPMLALSGAADLTGEAEAETGGGDVGSTMGAAASLGGMFGGGSDTKAVADPSAMSRRMSTQSQDPVMTLATAKDALSYQPPEIQKEYGGTINQALKLAQQSRQNARIS